MTEAGGPKEATRRPQPETAVEAGHAGETLFGSSIAQAATRTLRHFQGYDANEAGGPPDATEVWGRRIGRALSLAVTLVLGAYLYLTYVR
jgi:hypothetical protein